MAARVEETRTTIETLDDGRSRYRWPSRTLLVLLVASFPLWFSADNTHFYHQTRLALFAIAALIALFLAFLHVFVRNRQLTVPAGSFVPGLLLAGWCTISLLWNPAPWSGAGALWQQLTFTLGALAIVSILADRGTLSKFLSALGLATAAAAVAFLVDYLRPPPSGVRLPGFAFPFGNPNLAAAWFLVPSLVALRCGCRLAANGRAAAGCACLLLFVLTVVAIGVSGSKGAQGALLAALVLMGLHEAPGSWRGRAALVAGLALAAGGVWLLGRQRIEDWLGKSLWKRGHYWGASWRLYRSGSPLRPLVGHGRGSFYPLASRHIDPRLYTDPQERRQQTLRFPHSLPLEILTETGLVGLVLLLAVFGHPYLNYWIVRARAPGDRALAAGLAFGVTALGIHSLVSISLDYPTGLFALWISIGLLALLRELGTPPVLEACRRWPRSLRRRPRRLGIFACACTLVTGSLLAYHFPLRTLACERRFVVGLWTHGEPDLRASLRLGYETVETLRYRLQLAVVLFNRGRFREALVHLEHIDGRVAFDGDVKILTGRCHLALGRPGRALSVFVQHVQHDPYDEEPYARWIHHWGERRVRGALLLGESLERAIESLPRRNLRLEAMLVRLYADGGRRVRALALYRNLLAELGAHPAGDREAARLIRFLDRMRRRVGAE